MAISADTVRTASGLLKTAFGDYIDALPTNEVVVPRTSQVKSHKIGSEFVEAVNLEFGHSVTALGDKDQVTHLNAASYTPVVNSRTTSYCFEYREVLTETILQRAQKGQQAFQSAAVVSMERAQKSMTRILEELYMYGNSGLSQFTAVTAMLTNNQVTIDYQEFAPAVVIGSKGMPIDIVNKTTGNIILTTEIMGVSYPDTNISAAALTLKSVAGLVNGVTYTIYRKGFYKLSPAGLHDILFSENSLFGISESQYDLWAPNVVDNGGASLNYAGIAKAVQLYRAKGISKKITGICSDNQYLDLLPTYNSLNQTSTSPGPRSGVVFADREGKLNFGTTDINFMVNSTQVEIISSPYQKEGYFYGVDFDAVYRIGSEEKPFSLRALPGATEGNIENYLRWVNETTLYEFNLWSDTALFTSERNKHFGIKNILNAAPV